MINDKIEKLADLLVNYSTRIQKGENVLIDYTGSEPIDLIKCIIQKVYAAGGNPFVKSWSDTIRREILLQANKEQLDLQAKHDLAFMKDMDAYIAVRASDNTMELSDVPSEKMSMFSIATSETLDYRVEHTKWVILRYPNNAMAQLAGMSKEAFEKFYFDVCTLDYAKMDKAMDALKKRMDNADKVHLVGPNTDLRFSIKGIGSVKCAGHMNIPDGEVYSAPVRDSINGHIAYNTPSLEMGFTYENIEFDIENGKIVKATANDTKRINEFLDTDEGARYFGEFAIGVNPYVLSPMKDILFDEKICGSFHLTPGRCYDDCSNGNKSAIHWDLVMIQRPEYGGGEIWFDDELIRKDGLFVVDDLKCLNPENLR